MPGYHGTTRNMKNKPQHKQVRVTYPFTGEIIAVDKGLEDLLALVWALGFETAHSCRHHDDCDVSLTRTVKIAYIQIKHVTQGEEFLTLLASDRPPLPRDDLGREILKGGPDAIANRSIYGELLGGPSAYERYLSIHDDNLDSVKGKDWICRGPPKIKLSVTVNFPFGDKKYIKSLLAAELKNRGGKG